MRFAVWAYATVGAARRGVGRLLLGAVQIVAGAGWLLVGPIVTRRRRLRAADLRDIARIIDGLDPRLTAEARIARAEADRLDPPRRDLRLYPGPCTVGFTPG